MDDWQERALELLPEVEEEILEADSPMGLWIDIGCRFEQAYEEPRNEDFIRRVYEFSRWCMDHEQGYSAADDLWTAVALCFFEHLPTWKGAREDMPRWFTFEELEEMQQVFAYHQTEEEFEQLKDLYRSVVTPRRKRRKQKARGH